ncbi:MAG: M16 family metallopeptidase [Flavobacteriales bacterium]|jgi:predicted Zn-dependent peptidase
MQTEPDVFTLRNGIRVVHQPMNRTVAHCGLLIGAGSRDEMEHEHGLAHYMEHGLFKGTKKRKTYHILSRLDAVGGEINAFTAKEETWIHGSFLTEHYERAIELISDIAFFAQFPDHEMEKEKEVIIDEINSYKDSPSEMIFEDFDEQLFGKHPLGRSILGTPESVKSFRKKHLVEFRKRNYSASNLVFSSAGNITTAKLKLLLEKHFADHELKGNPLPREKKKGYKSHHSSVVKDIHQVHYVMGTLAYGYPHKMRPAFTLVNNLLGGPAMNNRLSLNIREKHGIAYQIDSTYAPFTDTGIFSIYLGTEKGQLEKSKALIWKELNAFKQKALTTRQLHEAKKQIIGQIGLAQDSGGALMFNLGKSLMLFDRIDTLEEIFQKVEEITAAQMLEVSNYIFDEKKMSSLTYTYE